MKVPPSGGGGASKDEIKSKENLRSIPAPARLDQDRRPRDGVATACRA